MAELETLNYLHEPGELLPGGYLGSMQDSLRLLPRYYQVLCICSVATLFWLDTPIVVNLLNHFHISFGTNFVWAEDYTLLLGSLHLHERVALAVYALGLIGLVGLILSCCVAASRYSLTPLQHALFPSRDQLNTFLWLAFAADTVVAVLVGIIPACSTSEILKDSDGSILSYAGVHAALQVEILKRVGSWWLRSTVFPGACTAFYRYVVDSGKPGGASRARPLRRYLSSFSWWRLILRFVGATFGSFPSNPLEIQVEFISAVVISLVLNHQCGPADLTGDIHGLSRKRHALHAFTTIFYCCSVSAVVGLCLVACLVGVHVVELIAVWIIFTIVTLWVPAAFDSFALDYIASMLVIACTALTYYDIVPLRTALRMWVVWFAAATALASFINFTSNVLRSRKVCLGLVLCSTAVALYLQEQKLKFTANIASAIVEMDSRALGFTAGSLDVLASSFSSITGLETSGSSGDFSPNVSFLSNSALAVAVALFFTGLNEVTARRRSSTTRQSIAARRKRRLPLVTVEVLVVKLSQVLIFGAFVSFSTGVTLFLRHYLLPLFMSILPHELHWVVAAVGGCVTFGALMDSREDCLIHVLRSLGLINPPRSDLSCDGVNAEVDAESPIQ